MATGIKGLDGGSIGPDSGSPVERVRVTSPVNSGGSGASANSASTDNVHITESAKTLASLSQAVNASPDVDLNKVTAVQNALSAGTYRINPESIADRMVQLDQDLGAAQHS
ncbi:MAG TPA: flagellar biosynthesis anti-sigma factor FlgM [Steroidobacteraceae bacterium]|nr:flagellar biosynthesis anti-sigma factor FlgM [Steroidobacteraceae bacterium]